MDPKLKSTIWHGANKLSSRSYVCGYCNESISSEQGYFATYGPSPYLFGYICHNCRCLTFFDADGKQTPGSSYGDEVKSIDDQIIVALYNEARGCCQVGAYTSAVLSCRKLLMHIAVSKGAEGNKPFSHYVSFLSDKNYVPPDAKEWVDHIRTTGNEATHEIKLMTKDDAEHLIDFCNMLLKVIYEFPAAAKKRIPAKP